MKYLHLSIFLLPLYSHAMDFSHLGWGTISCHWNESEDSCHNNGCLWRDDAFWRNCQSPENLSPKALLETIRQQRKFERSVLLLSSKSENPYTPSDPSSYNPDYLYKPSTLSYYFTIYGSNSHRLISQELRDALKTHPQKRLNEFSERIREMNLYILLLPKTTQESIVYRGLHECPDEFITHPSSFVSTSFDPKCAQFFSKECLVEILIPKGFPFISPHATPEKEGTTFGKSHEKEILLPSHVLNQHNELVPIRFEVLKRDGKNVIARPTGALTWHSGKESIEQYEKHYVQAVCKSVNDPESVRMCKKAKEYYKIHTHDEL